VTQADVPITSFDVGTHFRNVGAWTGSLTGSPGAVPALGPWGAAIVGALMLASGWVGTRRRP